MSNNYSSQVKIAGKAVSVECRKLINGHFDNSKSSVVIEKELHISINGEHLVTTAITPGMEREFVTGYLFVQGLIDDIEELESINIKDNSARVITKDSREISQRIAKTDYRTVSGGGKTVIFNGMSLPRINSLMKTGQKEIFKAMNTIFKKSRTYNKTEGTHAAGLFTPEAMPICIVEDIGRHNTLDKVIGYALINKIDLGNTFLVSTGRMASEMVTKICRAKIPIVATKTAITRAGLDIGQEFGLTIIGFVRDTGTKINTDMETRIIKEPVMKIYTNAERIIGQVSAKTKSRAKIS